MLVSVWLAGCGASVQVRVDVQKAGTGTVSVIVSLPKVTAAEIVDLRTGLPVGDLTRAGWVVSGPRLGPGGGTVVSAMHSFSQPSEVPVLIGDIAGSGALASRPFRLTVRREQGLLEDHFAASGVVNLTCSLDCFDDLALKGRVGYPLGLPPRQLAQLLGPHPERSVSFSFLLSLPGSTTSTNALGQPGTWLHWSPALGTVTQVEATSRLVNVSFVRDLLIAVGAGGLVVAITATLLLARRRSRLAGPGPEGTSSGDVGSGASGLGSSGSSSAVTSSAGTSASSTSSSGTSSGSIGARPSGPGSPVDS